jgi:Tol biopolymer transport system component
MKTIKLSAALALALMAALLAADASSASSLVFTKGGNVWRSSPDGRHQTRLTRDGGYSSPSQDDRGRVLVAEGRIGREAVAA